MVYPDFSILLHGILMLEEIVLALNSLRYNMVEKVQLSYVGQNILDTEKKYSITEAEALSVIVAIQKCRSYLLGN